MNKEVILDSLRVGAVHITFTKKDGTERVMKCTLDDQLIPQPELPLEENKKEKKINPDVQAVWDIEKEGWRSFRWDSVKEWNVGG